jgi:methyl-accepting chemotaxis protein
MPEKYTRRRVKNFFLKKSIQLRMTASIFFTVVLMGLITTGLLAFIYNTKSQQGSFYYMSNDVMQDLELTSVLGIILPPIITVDIIAVIIAFVVGLLSSRAVAVPLYKIEKWASRLKNGKLNTTLAFREEKSMKDLTLQCNAVTDFFRTLCIDLREHADAIAHHPNDVPLVVLRAQRIRELLDKVEVQ